MARDRLGSGPQASPLLSGSTDAPIPTAGNQTSFFFNTVPDRCPSPGLAYILPFVLLTLKFSITQSGGTGVVIAGDRVVGQLFDSFEISNAWHATPISANNVKGVHHQIWENIGNGFRYASRRLEAVPAANGTYNRELQILLPLSCRFGALMRETAQLSLLYQNAQLKVNMAPTTRITTLSPGSSVTFTSLRASAILVPTTELVLGTPFEFVLSQFSSGGSMVQIPKFGTDTNLSGVQAKGGVGWLGWITGELDQGGSFVTGNLTQFNFDWRGQQFTNHMDALALTQFWAMFADEPRVGTQDTSVANPTILDVNNFPYTQSNTVRIQGQALSSMYAFPLVPGSDDLQLTDLQTASGDQKFNATVTGGFGGTPHQILGYYGRVWEAPKAIDWVNQLMAGGSNSLASYVLGGVDQANAAAKLGLQVRRPRTQVQLTGDQATYLSHQLTTVQI